jgi:hypothetical protein
MLYCAVKHLRSSWTKFTAFFNDTFFSQDSGSGLTSEQVYRLFVEYFGRVLLDAHNALDSFTTLSNITAEELVCHLLELLGKDGGCVPGAKMHSCEDCMHPKQYNDQQAESHQPSDAFLVAGINDSHQVNIF